MPRVGSLPISCTRFSPTPIRLSDNIEGARTVGRPFETQPSKTALTRLDRRPPDPVAMWNRRL
jgi:hypothetical protein